MTHAMTAMPKYESFKDSGEGWIGEIPSHWEVEKLKYLFYEKRHRQNMSLSSGSISFGEVIGKDDEKVLESTKRSYQEVLEGEFLLNPLNLNYDLKSLRIALSKINVVVSAGYIILKEKTDINKQYFKYLLHRFDVAHMKLMGAGVRQTINYGHIANSLLLLPSPKEQEAIAQFLDEKTEQLDEAIGIKEQQIALLKERKQIIIQNAVKKGLNPTAPMKDSAVDWIGDIPAHWKVKKLFGLCRFVRGNSAFAKDELLSNGKYVALQYGKTYKVDEVDNSYDFYVNEEFYKESQVVNFGDIIFISTSETIEDLGHSAIYNRDDVGLLGGEQLLIKPNNDLLDHYYIYYSTKVFSKMLRKYATGIKVFRFNINDLKTIYTAVPPKEEQAKIASYIKDSLEQVDKAIDLQQAQIDKLKEYKASLINSAVTGKIKVI